MTLQDAGSVSGENIRMPKQEICTLGMDTAVNVAFRYYSFYEGVHAYAPPLIRRPKSEQTEKRTFLQDTRLIL